MRDILFSFLIGMTRVAGRILILLMKTHIHFKYIGRNGAAIIALHMATPAPVELWCLSTPRTEKPLDVLTCEDMSGDWGGFRNSIEAPNHTHAAVRPVTLSRSIQIHCDGVSALIVSRSASIDETGRTLHCGDLRAQITRAFVNISELLAAAGTSWSDVVRMHAFLRNTPRDGPVLLEEFDAFCCRQEMTIPPFSSTVEAVLARSELLVEVEAIAIKAG